MTAINKAFSTLFTAALMAVPAFGGPSDIFENYEVPRIDPVVDAGAFYNYGEIQVTSVLAGLGLPPWDTQNTRYFENRGSIVGSPGFRFEYIDPTVLGQQRGPADTFINAGTIAGADGGGLFTPLIFIADTSYISVNAYNVRNTGSITTGPAGVVRVHGQSVDLSGSALGIDPLGTRSSFATFGRGIFITETNFFPDPGIYDQGWSIESLTNFFPGGILNITATNITVQTPNGFNITNQFECFTFLSLDNPQIWVRETAPNSTNRNIQVVVVKTGDTNISADVRFTPLTFPNGFVPPDGILSPIVQISSSGTNLLTSRPETNLLYVVDQLATHTNQNLLVNQIEGTFRPAPIIVFRGDVFWRSNYFDDGFPSNSIITPDIFDSPIYSNVVVTNLQVGYASQIESLEYRLPNVPGVGVTNYPGRVEVRATDLTMTGTRIRGEGLVSIKTTNLVDSSDSIVDVSRINLNLGVAPGAQALSVRGFTPDTVQRMNGPIVVYSTTWTNNAPNLDTNLTTQVNFHLLMVDATGLRGTEPVTTHELVLNAPAGTRLEIQNNIRVQDHLSVNSDNLTINGRLVLQRGLLWSPTNFTSLRNLTNNGFLHSAGLSQFVRNGGRSYDNFVNRGTILSAATLVNADYFENTGSIVSTQLFTELATNDFCLGTVELTTYAAPSIGIISINANTAKIDAGNLSTAGDIRFTGGIFKVNQMAASAGGAMFVNVRENLTDSGPIAKNRWEVNDGFHVAYPTLPGDLLGTSIRTFATERDVVDHTWSALDRGTNVTGFIQNLALGSLRIDGENSSRFTFRSGTNRASALYVDLLEIQGSPAANVASLVTALRLSNLNIYYGDVVSSNANLTAESLNGLVLGVTGAVTNRLIWAPDFVGPNTSIDVAIRPNSPETIRMNRSLRDSPVIDSDNDGIPNRFDEFPTNPDKTLVISGAGVVQGNGGIVFTFESQPSQRYIVEYTTDIGSAVWNVLNGNLQSPPNGGTITVTDVVKAGSQKRFYRVRVAP